jgi:hypothetical protein
LGEARYAISTYPEQSTADTSGVTLLIGGELTLSRRFSAGLRFGEEVQTYTEGGTSASSPHVEATLNYRIGAGTSVAWNAEYGYEASGSADFRNLTARTGLQIAQVFTPRLQATLGVNLLRSSTTSLNVPATSVAVSTVATPNTLGLSPDSVQDTIDTSIGFYYTLDRHWSLNLTYSYTMMDITPQASTDYFRQRVFLGASYQF